MLNFENAKEQTNKYPNSKYPNGSIYDYISDLDIYFRILGYYPELRKKYKSPYTKDSNPSFCFIQVKERLRYHCFSSGKSGDAIQMVSDFNCINYKEAVALVYNNFPLTNTPIQSFVYKPSKPAKIEVVLFDKDPESFYEYWNSFCISKKTLELYNIRAAKEVWLNDKLYSVYSDKSPVIRYLIGSNYKIYQPLNPKAKWISNCRITDIQGWTQLPFTGDLLIISKAYKDVCLLREFGYDAFALCSETTNLSQPLVDNIKGRFKRIVSFLDSDIAGLATMNKYYDQYQIPFVSMPLNTECKDLSDFAYLYGPEESMKILEQLGL